MSTARTAASTQHAATVHPRSPDTAHHHHRRRAPADCGPMCSFRAIAAANDVRCDVASNSTFVYAYGFAEDTRHQPRPLYASLVVQMVRASGHLARAQHPGPPTARPLPAGVQRPGRPAYRCPRADSAGSQGPWIVRLANSAGQDIELHEYNVPRRAAPGEPAGPPRDTIVGAPDRAGRYWEQLPSCPWHKQRARVYAALFDRVTRHGSPTVEFFLGTQPNAALSAANGAALRGRGLCRPGGRIRRRRRAATAAKTMAAQALPGTRPAHRCRRELALAQGGASFKARCHRHGTRVCGDGTPDRAGDVGPEVGHHFLHRFTQEGAERARRRPAGT